MARRDQARETFLEVEPAHAAVKGAQLRQRRLVHGARQLAQDEEYEYFRVQFSVYEAEFLHARGPLS